MTEGAEFDINAGHKFFSAHCFNKTWDMIERSDRSAVDSQTMLHSAHASVWHWLQRPDCTKRNMSMGYWQLARVYALVGQAETSRRYGELCLEASTNDQPFYVGYAYEALARAEAVAGNQPKAREHLLAARGLLEQVSDPEEKNLLSTDLDTIVI